MNVRIRVLLIHNHLGLHPITWFGLAIRVFTSSRWNHNAIEVTTETGERFVLESIGKGIIYTPYDKWLTKGKRTVLPLAVPQPEVPLKTIEEMIGQPYGFRDILRIIKYIIQHRWLGMPCNWQKMAYKAKGYICSEVVSELLGLDPATLMLPGDFEHLPGVIKEKEFKTQKAR